MRLKPTESAPLFEATTWDGNSICLEDLSGHKVWLAFFRYASCPICNLRIQRMIEAYPTFAESGLRILCVFQSPADTIAESVAKQEPPFELLADPDQEIYEIYGVQTSLKGFLDPRNLKPLADGIAAGFNLGKMDGPKTRIPADFLIDADQQIHTAFYGDLISDHLPLAQVEAFVSER